jgi:hypothetical protein
MATLTESKYISDVVAWEEDGHYYSRDVVTVASGSNLALGTVIGIVTATGKAVQLNPTASDGSEKAAGVLIEAVDATNADAKGLYIAREAILRPSGLVWPDGITTAQRNTALGQLKALGILMTQEA